MYASELIKKLQQLILTNGNLQCFISGSDYPEEVKDIVVNLKEHNYLPSKCFVLR